MRVVWTQKARARLRQIHDYISENSSPQRAEDVVGRLLARSMTLRDAPQVGRRVPEYRRDDLCELLERPYRLIYRVFTDRISIVTVKHYRQRLEDHPQDL